MRIARVFPRKTKASPEDSLAFFGPPPPQDLEVDKVELSVTFTFDIPAIDALVKAWRRVTSDISIGGPAIGTYAGEFEPGRYLKQGYVITSRGCPNRCWFCDVPKREGGIRELQVKDGFNVLDSNLLACSPQHILKVMKMLKGQKAQGNKVAFTGGLEAARLTRSMASLLWDLRPDRMFFAYDTPNDLEPLRQAGRLLKEADFTRRHMYCYVLIGYPKDTMEKAEARLDQAWDAGFVPMAMLFKGTTKGTQGGRSSEEWEKFQRIWTRPAIIRSNMRRRRMEELSDDWREA